MTAPTDTKRWFVEDLARGDRYRWGPLETQVVAVDPQPDGRILLTHTDTRPGRPFGSTLNVLHDPRHVVDVTWQAGYVAPDPDGDSIDASLVRNYLRALDASRDHYVATARNAEPEHAVRARRARTLTAAEEALRDAARATLEVPR